MEELWKDIEGYDGKYQISNTGKVRSFSRWKNGGILKGGWAGNPGPYHQVNLVKTGRKDKKLYYVHRLVAQYFVDNPYGYTEVNHIDGDTQNNNADNLEWCSHEENMKHASKIGALSKGQSAHSGSKHPNAKAVYQMDMDGNIVKEWGSVNEIMRLTGINASGIFRCCNPKNQHEKTCAGFKWVYKENYENR